ncbi:hypothetical protein ARAM_001713 [Aspergillus rambellii]|uniref:AB hydrolase-1 domain-containing protein n=1 Tax=Aspergillus rambellii TaxID=308745 RepID=A0A0F8W6N3_9EURO|nr:hypothetical protein ARAM_001713 [Aspergillus rambellii]
MKPTSAQHDWTTETGSTMVSIGTHSLYMSITGAVRQPGDPIVVIIAGAGDVASSYVALEPLVSSFSRILIYDRSGLGQSQSTPTDPSAVRAAEELRMLLQAADISPPLLLMGHSYGGIVAREFLHLYADEVAGMVLCDAATERTHEYFRLHDPNIVAVMGDLKYADVTGLRANSKLSREQWRTRAIEISNSMAATRAEAATYIDVCETLKAKEQYRNKALGSKPLSVICANSAQDYERIYEKGVEAGNGTQEQRRAFHELLDRWDTTNRMLQEEQLQLSSNAHLIPIPDCGHNVHLVRPDVLADEIRWVWEKILETSDQPTESI